MAAQGPSQAAEALRVPLRIVHAPDQAVLQSDPPACLLEIGGAGIHQLLNGIAPGYGHQRLPLFVRGGVQGQGQGNLELLLGQPPHLRHQAAGGHRHVPLADMEPVLVRKHTDERQQIVVIVQRLPGAHDHHIAHPLSRQQRDGIDLIQHLPGGEVALQPLYARSAESAAHPAAHLGGDADAVAVLVLHPDALHQVPVRELEEEFLRAVYLGLLHLDGLERSVGETFPALLPQGLGEIGHLPEAPGQLHMHPLVELPGPESLLPHGGHLCRKLRQRQRFHVYSLPDPFIHCPVPFLFCKPKLFPASPGSPKRNAASAPCSLFLLYGSRAFTAVRHLSSCGTWL